MSIGFGLASGANLLNTDAIVAAINLAANNSEPGKTLFKTATSGGRSLGEINNDGVLTSADALAYARWAAGTNSDAAQVTWIEGTLNPYILANSTTYAAYLNGGSSQSIVFPDGSSQNKSTANTVTNSLGYTYPVKLMYTADQNTNLWRLYVIMSDGRVKFWGKGDSWGAGNGHPHHSPTPVDVGFPRSFPGAFEVYPGYDYITACIDKNGQLWTWGDNRYGSGGSGYGNVWPLRQPFNASTEAFNSIYGKTVTHVAMPCGTQSGDFMLVLCSDGTLHACGYNDYGQLGQGNTDTLTHFNTVKISGGDNLTGVASISCGRNGPGSASAVTTAGALYVWGHGGEYQLGAGNTTGQYYPQPRSNGSLSGKTIAKCWTKYTAMYVLCTDGTLHAMGTPQQGRFGLGNNSVQSIPVQINTNVAHIVTSGYDYTINVVIKNDNTVWYAGYPDYINPRNIVSSYDSYGNPSGYTYLYNYGWYQLTGFTGTVKKVSVAGTGSFNNIAILNTDGDVYCYGYNNRGQCGGATGYGSDPDRHTNGIDLQTDGDSPALTVRWPYKHASTGRAGFSGPTKVVIDPVEDICSFGPDNRTGFMALTKKNEVKIWGAGDSYYTLGQGSAVLAYTGVPIKVSFN